MLWERQLWQEPSNCLGFEACLLQITPEPALWLKTPKLSLLGKKGEKIQPHENNKEFGQENTPNNKCNSDMPYTPWLKPAPVNTLVFLFAHVLASNAYCICTPIYG